MPSDNNLKAKTAMFTIFLILTTVLAMSCKECPTEPEDNDYDMRNITQTDKYIEVQPELAVDSQGNVHVVYFGTDNYYTGTCEVYYIWKNAKGKWSEPLNLSNSNNDSRVPQISIDSKDNIHVIWEEDTESDCKTYYTMKEFKGNWTTPATITSISNDLPKLGIDGLDNVHIIGMGYLHGLYRKKENGIWLSEEQMPYGLMNPELEVSQSGNVHIAYEINHLNIGIAYGHKLADIGWQAHEFLCDESDYPWVPDIVCDDSEKVYISWTVRNTHQIKIRIRYPDGNWSEIDSIPNIEGEPWFSKLSIDENGLHVVWNAYTEKYDFDIYYQFRSNGGVWGARQNISKTKSASLDPGIYLEGNIIHIAWCEKYEENHNSNSDIYYTKILLNQGG